MGVNNELPDLGTVDFAAAEAAGLDLAAVEVPDFFLAGAVTVRPKCRETSALDRSFLAAVGW